VQCGASTENSVEEKLNKIKFYEFGKTSKKVFFFIAVIWLRITPALHLTYCLRFGAGDRALSCSRLDK
jgi:hypothetical protein